MHSGKATDVSVMSS